MKDNPLLGVVLSNWKVPELKYENPLKQDHTIMVNNRVFMEMAAETGVADSAVRNLPNFTLLINKRIYLEGILAQAKMTR